tara:strand:+ start:321 stop:578 length:258 start_codon:yes stop_codon:yes gene_type:complete
VVNWWQRCARHGCGPIEDVANPKRHLVDVRHVDEAWENVAEVVIAWSQRDHLLRHHRGRVLAARARKIAVLPWVFCVRDRTDWNQ